MPYASLRDFITRLEAAGRLKRVAVPVSPFLEMTEIQTRLLAEGGPADLSDLTYAEMSTPAGLKAVAAYADGIGPDWRMILPTAADGTLAPATSLVADGHAAGLKSHPWTVRAENFFLPPALRRGADPAAHGDVEAVYKALYAAGVDGLFSDFPALAAKARGAL